MNGCHQNELKTADKKHNNPQVNHINPVHQLMYFKEKISMFIIIQSIIKFQLKYKPSIHNIAFTRGKAIFSESGEKYAHISLQAPFTSKNSSKQIRREICTYSISLQALFTSKNSSKQISWWVMIWEHNSGWTFEGYFGLWSHILAINNGLKLKRLNVGFVSYKHAAFTSQYVNW